jgi:hypothetical protein
MARATSQIQLTAVATAGFQDFTKSLPLVAVHFVTSSCSILPAITAEDTCVGHESRDWSMRVALYVRAVHNACIYVFSCVAANLRVSSCVCVRERERERKKVNVCVCFVVCADSCNSHLANMRYHAQSEHATSGDKTPEIYVYIHLYVYIRI